MKIRSEKRRLMMMLHMFLFVHLALLLSVEAVRTTSFTVHSLGKAVCPSLLGNYQSDSSLSQRWSNSEKSTVLWNDSEMTPRSNRWTISKTSDNLRASALAYLDSLADDPMDISFTDDGYWHVRRDLDSEEWKSDSSLRLTRYPSAIGTQEWTQSHSECISAGITNSGVSRGIDSLDYLAEPEGTITTSTRFFSHSTRKVIYFNHSHWLLSPFDYDLSKPHRPQKTDNPFKHSVFLNPAYITIDEQIILAYLKVINDDGTSLEPCSSSDESGDTHSSDQVCEESSLLFYQMDSDKHQWTIVDKKSSSSELMWVHCSVPGRSFFEQKMQHLNNDNIPERQGWPFLRGNTFSGPVSQISIISDKESGEIKPFYYYEWPHSEDTHVINRMIPAVGLGTAALMNDKEVIEWGIGAGFRLIDSASDTAPWYQNEYILGGMIEEGTLIQTDQLNVSDHYSLFDAVYLTTKLFGEEHGYQSASEAITRSLKALKSSSMDLYLIHHPQCTRRDRWSCEGTWLSSWLAMEDAYLASKIRFVGMSNVQFGQMVQLLQQSRVPVSVVQNWSDPLRQDLSVMELCRRLGIVFQAYSLFGTQHAMARSDGSNPVMNHPVLMEMVKRLSKEHGHLQDLSIAKVLLRWAFQRGWIPLPRSRNRRRIIANNDFFGFVLSERYMNIIDKLHKGF